MRQAGRSLPEYRALRERHGFFEIAGTPELCAEVTLQPVRRHGVDAAVLFADIMSPVLGMGVDVELVEGVGPVVEERIDSAAAVERLRVAAPEEWAAPILEAVRLVRGELEPERALVGFCGGPFTVAGYLVEGKPSRDFVRTKTLMYREPATWHALMERLTEQFARYVAATAEAGADAIQLFDSWVGVLSVEDYREFVAPYSARVLDAAGVPTIHFGTGATTQLLAEMAAAGGSARRRRLAHPARRRVDGGRGRARDPGESRAGRAARSMGAGGVGGARRAAAGGRPAGPRLQPRARRPPADRSRRADEARGAGPQLRSSGMKSAVVLMAYGSPERLADVPAYYSDIRGGRPIAPEHLADLVERYRRLGIEDSSPLNAITEQTRAALEAELGLPVFTGMKHWTPRIADAAEAAVASGAEEVVGLVLAPHYSSLSIAGYREQLERALARPRRAALRRELARRARLRRAARRSRPRHRRARRLHGALAAGADPRRGRSVPRPAARDVAARRRGGGATAPGASPSRASRRPASRGSGRTSSTTSSLCGSRASSGSSSVRSVSSPTTWRSAGIWTSKRRRRQASSACSSSGSRCRTPTRSSWARLG